MVSQVMCALEKTPSLGSKGCIVPHALKFNFEIKGVIDLKFKLKAKSRNCSKAWQHVSPRHGGLRVSFIPWTFCAGQSITIFAVLFSS